MRFGMSTASGTNETIAFLKPISGLPVTSCSLDSVAKSSGGVSTNHGAMSKNRVLGGRGGADALLVVWVERGVCEVDYRRVRRGEVGDTVGNAAGDEE
jgi:hypothetical protein